MVSSTPTLDLLKARVEQLPADFGEGWMSRNARDMVRIGLIAGLDPQEFVRRLVFAGNVNRQMNAGTVERIIGELVDEHRAEHPELYGSPS